MTAKLISWCHGHMPTREKLEANRWLRPFAHQVLRADLWRFTRRSVPRGMALGLFIGIIIPLAHFVVAALLAVFLRANVPVALLATFIGNPVTVVGLWALAYKLGSLLLHVDAVTFVQPMVTSRTDTLLERITGAGLATACGLLVLATVIAAVGYFASGFGWRFWIARKRRLRLAHALSHRLAE